MSRHLPKLRIQLAATLALGLALAGCAARPDPADPEAVAEFEQTNDPLEPLNRGMYFVNDGLDTLVLRPAAEAYRIFIPPEVRNRDARAAAGLSATLRTGADPKSLCPFRRIPGGALLPSPHPCADG